MLYSMINVNAKFNMKEANGSGKYYLIKETGGTGLMLSYSVASRAVNLKLQRNADDPCMLKL